MASLLVKVKQKMSIYAYHKVRNVFDGEYGSVFKGRSLDFDDLREYVIGDDVKDIDWKGTARSGRTLIRRYVAVRKHNIMLVLDTGRNMTTQAPDGIAKKDIAVFAAGVIGYLAMQHGDLVMAVAGDSDTSHHFPLKGSDAHLENILHFADDHTTLQSGTGGVLRQLDYIKRHVRRRTIMIIITDQLTISPEEENLLRRLSVQHEIMWLSIGDADPTAQIYRSAEVVDIITRQDLPRFFRKNKKLHAEYADFVRAQQQSRLKSLQRLAIVNENIEAEKSTLQHIFRLLERKKYVKY